MWLITCLNTHVTCQKNSSTRHNTSRQWQNMWHVNKVDKLILVTWHVIYDMRPKWIYPVLDTEGIHARARTHARAHMQCAWVAETCEWILLCLWREKVHITRDTYEWVHSCWMMWLIHMCHVWSEVIHMCHVTHPWWDWIHPIFITTERDRERETLTHTHTHTHTHTDPYRIHVTCACTHYVWSSRRLWVLPQRNVATHVKLTTMNNPDPNP